MRVPLSAAARRLIAAEPALWANVLGGGDDYELVIAVPPRKRSRAARRGAVGKDQGDRASARFTRGAGVELTVGRPTGPRAAQGLRSLLVSSLRRGRP